MKEKVLVSACLLGVNCKYDGGNNYSEKVMEYLKDKEIIPICPEQLGGLSTPRVSSEVKETCVITKDGKDVTENFQRGAEEVLELAKKLGIKKAVLKSRSPSCGKGKIYDGSFTHKTVDKSGVAAELLLKNKIAVITDEELD